MKEATVDQLCLTASLDDALVQGRLRPTATFLEVATWKNKQTKNERSTRSNQAFDRSAFPLLQNNP
eukprot:6074987-Amphidinium_carterae.1